MTVLNKQSIPKPRLAKETVSVPELGGDVVVQAIMLRDRFSISASGGPKFSHIAELLHLCVIDCESNPIFTAEEWEVWGGDNDDAAFRLFEVCQRLCKLGVPDPKNDPAPS